MKKNSHNFDFSAENPKNQEVEKKSIGSETSYFKRPLYLKKIGVL